MQNDTLKIAYFIDRLIRGGTEMQLVEQINRLAERGVQQELFCLYKSLEHDNISIKCRVHILGIRKLISFSCFKKLLSLSSYLKKNSFNIVQTYFFDSTLVGIMAGKLARTPQLFTCRRDLGFWYTKRLLFILRRINGITDKILVNSTAVKEVVIKKELVNPDKICIAPNGIDIQAFQYSPEERKKNRRELGIEAGQICIGMIANMSRKVKRVDLLIQAADELLSRSNEFHFVILGDGKLKNDLIAMTYNLGIEKKVTFLGRNISKHKVLSSIDIGVLTSDSEGFSNAIMEYMAAGLPVVATAVGGNVDLVEDGKTGFLVSRGEYKQLADRLLCLEKVSQTRQEFGNAAKTVIAKYDWDTIIDKTIAYYQKQ